MSAFAVGAFLGYAVVVAVVLRVRGRFFAAFVALVLGVFTLSSVALRPELRALGHLPDYLQATVYLHLLAFNWPRVRPLHFRCLVSWPASYFMSATLLGWPWALARGLGLSPAAVYAPYVAALLGVFESFYARESVRDLVLDAIDAGRLRRYPLGRPSDAPTLTLVQISDPHLGPFMSVARLSRICARAVERNPDFIFLTGDFLTLETNHDPRALHEALAPLASYRGRVFACLGNHDHDAPIVVRDALAAHGITLLVDEATVVDSPLGPVQVVGFDHRFRKRKARMAEVLARNPRPSGALRIVLLHDPSAFTRLPPGEADLVLSGHTHGGQIGLVTFGLPWTFLSLFRDFPDHGLWARGRDRLYVHRGTGHYGFPLRVGVPAEQSLLRVQRAPGADVS